MGPRRILGPLLALLLVLLPCGAFLTFLAIPNPFAASDEPHTADEAIRRVFAPDAQPIEFNERRRIDSTMGRR